MNLKQWAIFRFIANGHLRFCRREPQGVSRGVAFVEGRIRIRSWSRRRNAGCCYNQEAATATPFEVHKDSPSSPFTLCPSCQSQLSLYLILCPSIKLLCCPTKVQAGQNLRKIDQKTEAVKLLVGAVFCFLPIIFIAASATYNSFFLVLFPFSLSWRLIQIFLSIHSRLLHNCSLAKTLEARQSSCNSSSAALSVDKAEQSCSMVLKQSKVSECCYKQSKVSEWS